MSIIARIKAQVSLLTEAAKTVKYRTGYGGKHSAKCPFHDDSSPSLVLNSVKGTFRCYGCGAGGSVVDWVMERDGLGLFEAIDQLAEEYGINRDRDPLWEARRQVVLGNKAKAEKAREALTETTEPLAYLARRGVTPETVAHFELGATKQGDGVVIPFPDGFGSVVGFAIRWTDNRKPKYWNSSADDGFDKGGNLYNLHRARRAMKDRIFVVEGYFDVWSAHQAGFPATVGICTSKMTDAQAALLGQACDDGESVVLVPDADRTGRDRCADNILLLAAKAPKSRVYVVEMDGGKDLGDLSGNPEAVRALLSNPMGATEWLVRKALKDEPDLDGQMRTIERIAQGIANPIERDNLAELLASEWRKDVSVVREFLGTARERGRIDSAKLLSVGSSILDFVQQGDGLRIGFPSIDDMTRGIRPGEVFGLMARSGVGKTTVALNIAENLVRAYPDVPGIIFSMEQQAGPVEMRLAQIRYDMTRDAVTDHLLFGGVEDFQAAYKNLLICQEGGLSVADLEEYISIASARRFGARVGWIAIDYLGYVSAPPGIRDAYGASSYNAKAIKQLAKRHELAVIELIQTGRSGDGSGSEPVTMASARDSGVIEESVDFMGGIYRPALNNPSSIGTYDRMMFRLLKNRNGPLGESELTFKTSSMRVYEGVISNARSFRS